MRAGRRHFMAALADPASAQAARLREQLAAGAHSEWGRSLGLPAVCSRGEGSDDALRCAFQEVVPIQRWEDVAPWVERVASAAGDADPPLWLPEPVEFYERTSGSASAAKLIPYTAGLRAEFRAATDAWLYSMHYHGTGSQRPLGGRAYWSVSPALRGRQQTPNGTPIGIEDDAAYLGPLGRWAMARLFAVPTSVARIQGHDDWLSATLRHLLMATDLRLVSVWSPSFLLLLLEALEARCDTLLRTLPRARVRAIAAAQRDGATLPEACWPRLVLLSCWTAGGAARDVTLLRRHLPRVAIEPKGLMATEGVVSLPWIDPASGAGVVESELGPLLDSCHPLAVTSHTLEFIDLSAPDAPPRWAHELSPGSRYSPLLTTAGGLYRYELGDVVRCVGRVDRTPCIAFEGKRYAVSDLRGEKLHADHVERVLAAAAADIEAQVLFAVVLPAPDWSPPGYLLCLELDPAAVDPRAATRRFAALVEQGLRDNVHYDHARSLGQLQALNWSVVTAGSRWYAAAKQEQGMRLGDIKQVALDPNWRGALPRTHGSGA